MAHPDKVARYDRQLRLWGEAGQSFLERAHVLLLGVSVAGCETLKNLVLPGIGAFTVVDGRKVEPTDLGLNFFVTADSIGKPRARVCAELLGELNEYVKSHFVEEDPVTLIAKDPTFVASYTVVLASQLPEETLQSVARVCEARGIALLALRSLGLFGSLRISAPVHKVIESRRENQLEDLRVWAPFPSLAAFAQQFNPQTAHERHHIPYPVLLIHALNHFRASHGGQGPANRKQLDEVKALLKSWAPPGPLTENFDEALKATYKQCQPTKLPAAAARLLASGAGSTAGDAMELLLGALRRFVAAHDGVGPLHGGLPDLATTTTTFQQLQNIYAVQAEADLAEMQTHLQALAEAAGPAAGNVAADARSQLKTFVRNLGALEVKSFPSIIAEYSPGFRLHAGSPARAPTPHEALYVALRAAERFQTTHKRWPAVFDDELPSDLAALVPLATSLAADLGLESSGVPELVQEVCRSGSAELHATGALLGGVAAQEAIKLITRQWVPLSALWVFNGIASTAAVLPLTP